MQTFSLPMTLFDPLLRVLIGRWYGLEFLGLYDLAYKVAGNIRTLIQGYFNPIIPELSSIWTRNKHRAMIVTINYHKQSSWIIFISFATAIVFSPLLSIILLGQMDMEFIFIFTTIGFSWGLATLFLPTNLLARASDTLYYSILGQILTLLTGILGLYIVSLFNIKMLVPAIVGLSLVLGNIFGFICETHALRKKVSMVIDSEYISILVKCSIAFIFIALPFILFSI
jgi:O-antigen/teichoic acid export membrane protein